MYYLQKWNATFLHDLKFSWECGKYVPGFFRIFVVDRNEFGVGLRHGETLRTEEIVEVHVVKITSEVTLALKE